MPTDYSEKSYIEDRTYFENVRRRLSGQSVPLSELTELIRGVARRMVAGFQEVSAETIRQEYADWTHEEVIASTVYLAELSKMFGLQQRAWRGAEYTRTIHVSVRNSS